MGHGDARTREDFAALGSYRGDPAGLYRATRGRDFDIDVLDWLTAAAPPATIDPIEQVDSWVAAWMYCSRWAGTVRRPPAADWDVRRAGAGALIDEIRERILREVEHWHWPRVDALDDVGDDELELSYALLCAFEGITHWLFNPTVTEEERQEHQSWKLALTLELASRGQLPRVVTDVADYTGEERIVLAPTQLSFDEFGRDIPASRRKRIVDEWCDFLASAPTPIRSLRIASRAPKRLITALSGQTQLRELWVKWGDYDDLGAIASMPDLWSLTLGGATALEDVAPLASAPALRELHLGDCRRLTEVAPLAGLRAVESFAIHTRSIPTISFLRGMPRLRSLVLGAGVADEDYSPLLGRDLRRLWIRKQRRMHPSLAELTEHYPMLEYN